MADRTAGQVLVIVGAPLEPQHVDEIILQLNNGLSVCGATCAPTDLNIELLNLKNVGQEIVRDDKAHSGQSYVLEASSAVTLLINPGIEQVNNSLRHLLTRPTPCKHIVYSGPVFNAMFGGWVLSDGVYGPQDLCRIVQAAEVKAACDLNAADAELGVAVHSPAVGEWRNFAGIAGKINQKIKFTFNSTCDSPVSIDSAFGDFIKQILIPSALEDSMPQSDVVGGMIFDQTTLYVFPAGQGSSVLLAVPGFTMLVDCGSGAVPEAWKFIRHFDRLDALMLSSILPNYSVLAAANMVQRMAVAGNVRPAVGCVLANIPSLADVAPDSLNPLSVDPYNQAYRIIDSTKAIGKSVIPLQAPPSGKPNTPFTLYEKIGHGRLEAYVLTPAKESKEMKEFFDCFKNNAMRGKATTLIEQTSLSALLVWHPDSRSDPIHRILLCGAAPESVVMSALDRLKTLPFLKVSKPSKSSLSAKTPQGSASTLTSAKGPPAARSATAAASRTSAAATAKRPGTAPSKPAAAPAKRTSTAPVSTKQPAPRATARSATSTTTRPAPTAAATKRVPAAATKPALPSATRTTRASAPVQSTKPPSRLSTARPSAKTTAEKAIPTQGKTGAEKKTDDKVSQKVETPAEVPAEPPINVAAVPETAEAKMDNLVQFGASTAAADNVDDGLDNLLQLGTSTADAPTVQTDEQHSVTTEEQHNLPPAEASAIAPVEFPTNNTDGHAEIAKNDIAMVMDPPTPVSEVQVSSDLVSPERGITDQSVFLLDTPAVRVQPPSPLATDPPTGMTVDSAMEPVADSITKDVFESDDFFSALNSNVSEATGDHIGAKPHKTTVDPIWEVDQSVPLSDAGASDKEMYLQSDASLHEQDDSGAPNAADAVKVSFAGDTSLTGAAATHSNGHASTLEDIKQEWGAPHNIPPPTRAPAPAGRRSVAPSNTARAKGAVIAAPAVKPLSSPIHVDVVLLPQRGASSAFFSSVRSSHYVYSGVDLSAGLLDAWLAGKSAWSGAEETTKLIPTYDSDVLTNWLMTHEDEMAKLSADVAPSASRATLTLDGGMDQMSAYRLKL